MFLWPYEMNFGLTFIETGVSSINYEKQVETKAVLFERSWTLYN